MNWLFEFIKPPKALDPPEPALRWMWAATIAGWVMFAFICWALGVGSAVGLGLLGGGFARADDLSKLSASVTCSAKSSEIERTRQSLYEVKREIDKAGADARDLDRQRLNELTNALNDQMRRFSAVGCDKVL